MARTQSRWSWISAVTSRGLCNKDISGTFSYNFIISIIMPWSKVIDTFLFLCCLAEGMTSIFRPRVGVVFTRARSVNRVSLSGSHSLALPEGNTSAGRSYMLLSDIVLARAWDKVILALNSLVTKGIAFFRGVLDIIETWSKILLSTFFPSIARSKRYLPNRLPNLGLINLIASWS